MNPRAREKAWKGLRVLVLSALVLTAWTGKGWSVLPAPAGFSSAPSNGSVALQWTPVPGATAYYLFRDLVPTGTPSPTATPTATPTGVWTPSDPILVLAEGAATSYDDHQVTNGRTYLYQVGAWDGTGLGILAQATALPFSPPAAVSPLTVLNLHSNALDLSWAQPLSSFPVSYYQVYRFAVLTPTPPGTPTFSPTFTGTWTARPTSTPSPTPTLPAAPLAQATLVWSATPIATTLATSYVDTGAGGLLTGAVYYLVVAVDDQSPPGFGSIAAYSSKPGLPRTLAPAAPVLSGLVSSTATPMIGPAGFGTRLSWEGPAASEGITLYQVFSGSASIGSVPVDTPSPVYTFDDTSIPFANAAAVSTTYKVVAVSANGSTASNLVQEKILRPSLSGPLQVTPDTTQGVTLGWNNGTAGTYGLAGYRVFKSQAGPPATLALNQPGTPTPTGSATPTSTPSPFATVGITPSVAPTLAAVDPGQTNAHGWTYWVEPFDLLFKGGDVATAPTPVLNLAPAPPGNPSAAAVPGTNNQVSVSWPGGPSGFYGPVTGYALYRADTVQLTPTLVANLPASLTSFTDHAQGTPGTSVAYLVQSLDPKGNASKNSAFSNAVVLASTQVVPGAPQPLPVEGDASSIRFSWLDNPAADGVDHYEIFGADLGTATPMPTALATVLPTPTVSSFSLAAPAWSASVLYVRAHNGTGLGQAGTLAGLPVPPSYHVTAAVTPASTREVHLSWDLVPVLGTSTPGIGSFVVYRSTSAGASFTPIATVDVSASSFVDGTAGAGEDYHYRIVERAQGGGVTADSPLYPTLAPTPEGAASTWPKAPQAPRVTPGTSQNRLAWAPSDPQENVLHYVLWRNGSPTSTVTPAPTDQLDFSEAPGSLVSYQVGAINAQGEGDLSEAVTVLVPPAVTPTLGVTPPAGYSPTPGTTPGRWVWVSGLDPQGSVDGYEVYRSQVSPVTGFSLIGTLSSPASFLADPGAAAGVTQYYKVVAKGMGLSADPSLSGVSALEVWPAIPALAFTAGPAAVTLTLSPPPGDVTVDHYTLYRNDHPSLTPTPIATVLYPGTTFADLQVTPGRAYHYWADASNAEGPGPMPTAQAVIAGQAPLLALTPLPGRNTLSWSPVSLSAPSSLTGYGIYRAVATPGGTPAFNLVGAVNGMAASVYTDAAVLDSVSYLYKIAASTAGGAILGAFSNQVSVTVLPQPVLSLTAASGEGLVQLRWTYQGTAAASYTIQRKLGAEPESSYQDIKTGVTGVNYLDQGLLNKTYYSYRVVTVDSLGLTAVSPEVVGLPAAPPVLSDPSLSIQQGQGGNGLNWWPADTSHSAPASLYDLLDPTVMYPLGGYGVYRSADGGAVYQALAGIVPAQAGGMTPARVSFSDPVSLVGAPSYTYLVQAFDAPPDLPVPQDQAVTQGLVHTASYQTAIAYALKTGTTLDRNALRPFGTQAEQTVHIRFVVTVPGKVNIKVYTLNGTFVRELLDAEFPEGVYGLPGSSYPLSWDARNANGTLVASGVYLISTEMAGGHQEFQKVAVIK